MDYFAEQSKKSNFKGQKPNNDVQIHNEIDNQQWMKDAEEQLQ